MDEYDKPLPDARDESEPPADGRGAPRAGNAQAKANRDDLRGLYGTVKDCDAHVELTFLTGVSKFSKVSLFSDLNFLTDLTLNPRCAAICGYTDADLDTSSRRSAPASPAESRADAMGGKAMVVCMSRRICIDLYRELVRLRPGWRDEDDTRGALKVVMTGQASDPPDWQAHIGNKARREALAKRFRDPADPLRMVLVLDMWLTGFDASNLHTMYVDKPMRGHGLMQAIARVNRVFRDKPGGR